MSYPAIVRRNGVPSAADFLRPVRGGSYRALVIINEATGAIYTLNSAGQVVSGSGGESTPAAWGGITGTLSAQSDLQAALNGKAATGHNHDGAYDAVGSASAALASALAADFSGDYGDLSNIPSSFPPSAHGHSIGDVSGLQTALDGKAAASHGNHFSGDYNDLTNKPTLGDAAAKNVGTAAGTVAAGDHTHAGGGNNNVQARLTADRTTTSTTLANVTDLALAIDAGETIEFAAHLFCRCSGTGGSQYSVTVPAGATVRATVVGRGATATAQNSGELTASGGAGPTVNNANLAGGWVDIRGTVIAGATPGAIQVQHKSVTSGQTTTTHANSTISGRKH